MMTFTFKLVQMDRGLSFHYFCLGVYVHFLYLKEEEFVVNSNFHLHITEKNKQTTKKD